MILRKRNGVQKSRTFAVLGLGIFGSTVARELVRFGNHVIGIDTNEASVAQQTDALTEALIVDARDDQALREAGVADCDIAVVAMGQDLEASIVAAINLKTIGVPVIWAKATNKTHHRILSKLGVDRVIHPEMEMGRHIAQVLHNPIVRDYVSLGNGYHVVNFRVPEKLEGMMLGDLNHRAFELKCVAAMRGTEYIGQDGLGCELQKDDLLVLLGRRTDLMNFASELLWS